MRTPSLDHRSPWVIDTRWVGRRPGSLKTLQLELPVDEKVGTEVIAVVKGEIIDADLRLESVVEGVLVSGTASAVADGECARCLREVSLDLDVDLRELYAYPGSATAETTDEDELPRVQDDLIDIEPLIRDEITLALPLVPLCRPDCAGLCVECGERLDDLEQGHAHAIMDARWAALAEKFGSDGPVEPGSPGPSAES